MNSTVVLGTYCWSCSLKAAQTLSELACLPAPVINKPQNIADGNLMPLDDLLAEYGQGIVDILGENVVEIHRNADDGKLYYLPSWQGLVGDRRGWLVSVEVSTDMMSERM